MWVLYSFAKAVDNVTGAFSNSATPVSILCPTPTSIRDRKFPGTLMQPSCRGV